jgi:hypothetical protein
MILTAAVRALACSIRWTMMRWRHDDGADSRRRHSLPREELVDRELLLRRAFTAFVGRSS